MDSNSDDEPNVNNQNFRGRPKHKELNELSR